MTKDKRRNKRQSTTTQDHLIFHGVQLRNLFLVALALIGVNVFIYAQVRHFEFIGWDDPMYVTQNPEVLKGLCRQSVWWALTSGHAANWHPLTWLSHMLDVQFFGVAPGCHHLTNVLFHIANSLLLFWVLFRMTSAFGRSALVAGLFAVHPLHVESVAWVAERKDVLSTFLLLLTIWAYVGYVRRPFPRRYLLVLGLFALALMAKPMVVTLPFVLLLLDIWPLGRVRLAPCRQKVWLQLTREKIPFMMMAAAVSVVTLIVQHHAGTVGSFADFPLETRCANALVSYTAYLGKMLWPADLSPFYPHRPVSGLEIAASVLALTGISILALRISARRPWCLVGWSWYLITLIPVIGLVQVGGQARADRYTYLPLIGIFVVIAWGAPAIWGPRQYRKFALATGGTAVICLLTLSARIQAGYWKNPFVLWEHALNSTRDNAHAHVNLGFALVDRREVAKAISHYNEALRINPSFPEAQNALGVALLAQDRIEKATAHFVQALRFKPDFGDALNNMGMVLARQGRIAEAISHFARALSMRPGDAQVHQNLGLALTQVGRDDEAIAHYSEAIRIKPESAEPHLQLGNVLWNQGKVDRAIEQFREAIRNNPDFAEAHNNLGIAFLEQGRYREAATECSEALRINPKLTEAHNCLGTVLVRTGREDEAIDQYTRALGIRPDHAEAHSNLAAALINRMRDDEALVHLTEALRIKPDLVDARINFAIVLINKGREKEAINHLREVLRIQPDHQEAITILDVALARVRRK